MDAFLRQTEAWDYVKSITDTKERLLTEIAVAKALSYLAADSEYRRTFGKAPVDLLIYARVLHALFQRPDVIGGVLSGVITCIDDLDPF